MNPTRFAKFSWGVLGWTVLVILWGAIVRATGSGAGCGSHWPTCNGEAIPQTKTIETIIEFTHRSMSGLAMILVLILLIWALRGLPKGHPAKKGAIGSAAFIIIEALLGAGLVLFGLVKDNDSAVRAIVVAIYLLNTFILLGWLTLTAWWASGGGNLSLKNKKTLAGSVLLGLIGVAIVGMSGAITALGDTLFPSSSISHTLEQMNDPSAHFLINLRVYHPVIAIAVGVYALYHASYLRQKFAGNKQIRLLSLVLSGFILLQWMAGVINVLLLAPVWMQVIHLLLADSVLIAYILLSANALSSAEANSINR